uniref:Putative E3 SUMO-protein ligase SIZ1 n=2 Tax=Davidia involucrata TaxID=16924 RepID=A0A5B6ZMD3_DAVIN
MDLISSLEVPGGGIPCLANRHPFWKVEVAKLIEDTYRRTYAYEATDLGFDGQSGSLINCEMLQEELDDSIQFDTKIRCPCESPLLTESMVQCQDPQCYVLQHTGCVITMEEPMDAVPPVSPQYYCEACRIKRADPFWETVAHPLLPVKLTTTNTPVNGGRPVQHVERLFHLTRADRDLLLRTEYDVQVYCILLNDKVPFRMHWPQYPDLQVNGKTVQTINRPGSQLLGANGRDDGPLIKAYVSDGVNKISLTRRDARIFCLGVRIVKRLTAEQVLNLIFKQPNGEQFEDALGRVRRCIGGGSELENADSDSDLEVVSDSVTVNLRCPMSGSRIKVAARFKPCSHMGCFDLETFVELNQRARKWQCPICLRNYSLENIIIDPYFNCITTKMHCCGEDVTEIEVKPDGIWRAKNKNEGRQLAQWHFPDGTMCVPTDKVSIDLGNSSQIKQESISERHTGLILGTNKNCERFQVINKPGDMCTLSLANILPVEFENHSQNFIPMSNSATLSGRDGEDLSVDQEGDGHFDLSSNIGNEHDSVSLNFDPIYGDASKDPSAPAAGDAEIIALSDSDEENENFIFAGTSHETEQVAVRGINYKISLPEVLDSWPVDSSFSTDGSSCLNLKHNGNVSNVGMPHYTLPSVSQVSSGFQLFGSEVNLSDAYAQLSSIASPLPVNGYSLPPYMATGPPNIPDSSCCLNTKINDTSVGNPLPFGGKDPSLRSFLPTRPAGTSGHSNLTDQAGKTNGVCTVDWISLSFGGSVCNGEVLGYSPAESILHSRNQFVSVEDGMKFSANTASLPSVDDDMFGWTKMNMEIDDASLCCPQRDSSSFYHPCPPQPLRPCFSVTTTKNKDRDDRTKMMLPLGNTGFQNTMSNRMTMNGENNDLTLHCHCLPIDPERYGNPGYCRSQPQSVRPCFDMKTAIRESDNHGHCP